MQAGPGARCQYWSRRSSEAGQAHVMGILRWPPDHFVTLSSWAQGQAKGGVHRQHARLAASSSGHSAGARATHRHLRRRLLLRQRRDRTLFKRRPRARRGEDAFQTAIAEAEHRRGVGAENKGVLESMANAIGRLVAFGPSAKNTS